MSRAARPPRKPQFEGNSTSEPFASTNGTTNDLALDGVVDITGRIGGDDITLLDQLVITTPLEAGDDGVDPARPSVYHGGGSEADEGPADQRRDGGEVLHDGLRQPWAALQQRRDEASLWSSLSVITDESPVSSGGDGRC